MVSPPSQVPLPQAGGAIELARYEAPALFTTVKPDLPQSIEALKRITAFVHRTIPVPAGPQGG